MRFMGSDLAILSAEQYNFGFGDPLAAMKPSRPPKRKLVPTASAVSGAAASAAGHSQAALLEARPAQAEQPRRTRQPTKALSAHNTDSDEVEEDAEGAEGDADKKRSRGRPRIDARDITAADVRFPLPLPPSPPQHVY